VPCDDSGPAPQDTTGSAEYIAVGTVGKAVGLKGECRIFPFGNTLERIQLPVQLRVGSAVPEIAITLTALHGEPNGYKAFFGGYGSRESIESIKNHTLFIEKENLPVAGSDEFYHFELEGMSVFVEGAEESTGSVIRVHNYPTVDALEIRTNDGRNLTVPMTAQVIKRIDKGTRSIVIAPGALEDFI